MVAIITSPSTAHRPAQHPDARLRLVAPRGSSARPKARLLTFAALALVVLLAAGYLVTAPALGTPADIPVQDATHVVAPGETMWSIASATAPAGEAATYVERLVEVNGSSTVAAGQVLQLPVP